MNDDFKEAMDEARSRATFARYRKASAPKGAWTSGTTDTASEDVEPDWPPFCVVEYDTAGRVVYTFPARYEGDTDE